MKTSNLIRLVVIVSMASFISTGCQKDNDIGAAKKTTPVITSNRISGTGVTTTGVGGTGAASDGVGGTGAITNGINGGGN